MKKENAKSTPVLALWALYVRSSFYKILLVLVGMILTEGVLFWSVCRGMEGDTVPMTPERMIDRCSLQTVFLAAFGLVQFILLWTERQRGGVRSSYTLMRLKVTQRQQFALRTAYNVICLALVFVVQAALAVVLCGRYAKVLAEEFVSPQLLFLVFYRSPFLHSLLPMAELSRWVKNLFLLLAFGMEAALESRGRDSYLTSISLFIVSARLFAPDIGRLDVVFGILLYGFCIAASLLRVFGVIGERKAEDEAV